MSSEKISFEKLKAIVVVLGGSAMVAIATQALLSYFVPMSTTPGNMRASIINASEVPHETKAANPFESISLEAHAAYVFDLKTGTVLFTKNENEKLPLASVTKIMTALLAREHMPEGAVLTLTKDDLSAEGDSGLRTGERWRMGDLLNVMLIISSNDAAHAIASFVGANGGKDVDPAFSRLSFIKMMNEKAVALKLDQMQFFNESGLDIPTTSSAESIKNGVPATALATAGGYGSARNVAELFAELWAKYPETVEATAHKDARIYSQDKVAHILPNTNEIVGHIPGLIASKTGYTDLAGGNLAVIFDKGIGDPVVAVVLGSTYKGRFDDMQKIVGVVLKLEIPQKPKE